MQIPVAFRPECDKIHEEALEFRRLSSTERFVRIFGLSAFGEHLLKYSPTREQALALRRTSEEDWRRIHKELFHRHGL